MSTNPNIPLIEVPVGGNGGIVWNRLHAEREDICEAILKHSQTSDYEAVNVASNQLQDRLRKIDEALDRLMSGSYGECSKCGRWIEDTKLYFDPALAFCLDCQENEKRRTTRLLDGKMRRPEPDKNVDFSESDIALESLEEFDTVLVRTLNTDYRLLLLDPKSGRALVEGGAYLAEPREVLLSGSTLPHCPFKFGSIVVGYGLEMWIDEKVLRTSPIQSVRVEHHTPTESIEAISAAVQ